MMSAMRRSVLFGIAFLIFALIICYPSMAWAEQGSGDDPTSGGEPTASQIDGEPSEGTGAANGMQADGDDTQPAVGGAGQVDEGAGPMVPEVAEPESVIAEVQPGELAVESAPAASTANSAPAATTSAASTTSTTSTPKAETSTTVAKGSVADGVYYIYSAKSTSRALDVSGASKTSGANVLLWNANGQTNQQWRFTFDAKTGNYTIVSVNSGMALAFRSSSSGANVYQAKLSSSTRAIWSVSKTSSGYAISPAKNKGLALDIEGGAGANGDNIELWTSSGKSWQRYWLVAVNPNIKAEKTLDSGVYTISLSNSKGQKIDVDGGSQSNVANVLAYHSTGGANQRWYVSRDKDNFYTITSINSGKVLDVNGGGKLPGTNIIQYASNGQANQKWQIRDNGNGTYTVISKQSGLAMRAASTNDCANVYISVDTGYASVRFVFAKSNLVTDGVYSISPRQNMNEVADVPDYNKESGAQVALWKYNTGLNQKYQFINQGDETYTIQVAHSGKYLQDKGGKVVQSTKNNEQSQLWKATWNGTGIVLTNKATNHAITVSGTVKNGATFVTTKADGRSSQRFALTKRDLLEPGLYTLRSGTGSRVLDVNAASKAEKANMQLWASNGGNNQKYAIGALSNGYFTIVNLNSKKAMTTAGSTSGANVWQSAYSGSANQQWKAEVGPNGGVMFTDKQSGKVLSVAGNANADGANVQLAVKSGEKGQIWYLTATKTNDAVLNRAYSELKEYGTSTDHFVVVDLSNHRAVILKRIGGSWVDVVNSTVSTGAWDTPTTAGTFSIRTKGYSFGSGYTCYYWTQFDHGHKFHSILYNQDTFDVQDGRLGYSISHGCVRMRLEDAKYIYQYVPRGSRVRVY